MPPEAASQTIADKPRAARSALSLAAPWQHGAWSVLLLSWVLGAFAVRAETPVVPWLLLVPLTLGFIARHAFLVQRRLRPDDPRRPAVTACALATGVGSAAVFVVVAFAWGRHLLFALGAIALAFAGAQSLLERRRLDRTAWGELVGTVGLALAAPMASYSGTGQFTGAHVGLWLLTTLFFCGSVFHVRYVVREWRARGDTLGKRIASGASSVGYHVVAVVVVAALGVRGYLPSAAAIVLLPVTGKALWALRRGPDHPPVIRTVGFIELGHSLLFAALTIALFRLSASP